MSLLYQKVYHPCVKQQRFTVSKILKTVLIGTGIGGCFVLGKNLSNKENVRVDVILADSLARGVQTGCSLAIASGITKNWNSLTPSKWLWTTDLQYLFFANKRSFNEFSKLGMLISMGMVYISVAKTASSKKTNLLAHTWWGVAATGFGVWHYNCLSLINRRKALG